MNTLPHELTHGAQSSESRSTHHLYESDSALQTQEHRSGTHTHEQTQHLHPSATQNHHVQQPRTAARHAPTPTHHHAAAAAATRHPKTNARDPLPNEELTLTAIADYQPPKRGTSTPAPKQTPPRTTQQHGPRHSRAYVHARHLARVAYQQALKQYHQAMRQWRHLIAQREKLVKKLNSLEKRIAHQQLAAQKGHPSTTTIFEINNVWYQQRGHSHRKELTRPPL